MVYCETPEHGTKPHEENRDCVWPHYVGPVGRTPIVGHPLTVHD
jgi:hypothetical protein